MKQTRSILMGLIAIGATISLSGAVICPTTVNTNTDCGVIITIASGTPATVAIVPGANPYEGSDDVLVGVQNLSNTVFTGSFTLTGAGNGGGLFSFESDGICSFTAAAYCSTAATGYEGPLNTFSNITTTTVTKDTGTVNITGLAAGGTTYFSLESSPSSINGGTGPGIGGGTGGGTTPEPGTLPMLAGGLLCGAGLMLRRTYSSKKASRAA